MQGSSETRRGKRPSRPCSRVCSHGECELADGPEQHLPLGIVLLSHLVLAIARNIAVPSAIQSVQDFDMW